MEINPNSWMAQEIFKILTGMGHEILMFNNKGTRVYDADEAVFLYSNPAKMMIQLDYTKGNPPKPAVKFFASKTTPAELVNQVKRTLKKHNLFDHSFDTHIYGKIIEPKHFSKLLPKEPVTESAWSGSTRTSRKLVGECTQVVIRHNQRLADVENSPRWSRIQDIFIHGKDGTRYRCPWKHITGACAMAQHMDQGAQPWDSQGEQINTVVTTLMQLRRLRRWLAHHGDDTSQAAAEQLSNSLKNLLQKIGKTATYVDGMQQAQQMLESWQDHEPALLTEAPEDLMQAIRALDKQLSAIHVPGVDDTTTHMDEQMPELFMMESWFAQFAPEHMFEGHAQTRKQVSAAIEDTGSRDPRTVLQNLQDNHPYWIYRFEKDPKATLDTVRRAIQEV